LRLFSFGGYGLALVALALVIFGAIECPPQYSIPKTGGFVFSASYVYETEKEVVRTLVIFQDRPTFSRINGKLSPRPFDLSG